MDTETDGGRASRNAAWRAAGPVADPKPPPGKLKRIVVGAATALLALTLLYGPNQVLQMVALSVICTAGIGLIPILFISWLVGALVLAIWDGISARRGAVSAA